MGEIDIAPEGVFLSGGCAAGMCGGHIRPVSALSRRVRGSPSGLHRAN